MASVQSRFGQLVSLELEGNADIRCTCPTVAFAQLAGRTDGNMLRDWQDLACRSPNGLVVSSLGELVEAFGDESCRPPSVHVAVDWHLEGMERDWTVLDAGEVFVMNRTVVFGCEVDEHRKRSGGSSVVRMMFCGESGSLLRSFLKNLT